MIIHIPLGYSLEDAYAEAKRHIREGADKVVFGFNDYVVVVKPDDDYNKVANDYYNHANYVKEVLL